MSASLFYYFDIGIVNYIAGKKKKNYGYQLNGSFSSRRSV